ncbi:TrmB family transcriptional regulator [Propionivibrio soli]|uniref:TrmB family transcriptional regulator n=1 Tax=Propionivibrio soli TaxID=2976531 RepID=UPI0021E76A7B
MLAFRKLSPYSHHYYVVTHKTTIMIDPQTLIPLGLTAYEAGAYLSLLGRSSLTPPEVAARAKIPRQRAYDVLASLVAKGLCIEYGTNPKAFAAVDPHVALEYLASETAADLERRKQESAALATNLAVQLAPVFAQGRSHNDPLAYVEVLSGAARIAHRAVALAQGARKSVNSCIKSPLILSEQQNDAFMRTPIASGLRYRSLCDEPTLVDASVRSWLAQYRQMGMEIRVVPELPLKMQSFDDEIVLVSMQDPAGGPPSFTAVAIRNRGAVAMLNLAFEHLWCEATSFEG